MISPTGFIIIMDLLRALLDHHLKEENRIIIGENPGTDVTIMCYADDLNFNLRSIEDIEKIIEILKIFKEATSIEINLKKTFISLFNYNNRSQIEQNLLKKYKEDGITILEGHCEILGLKIEENGEKTKERNLKLRWEIASRKMLQYGSFGLSIYGRILVSKSLV